MNTHSIEKPDRKKRLAAVCLAVSLLTIAGCRSRAEVAKAESARASAADQASVSPENPPVIESKDLAIKDTEPDLPFAKEVRQSYELEKGAEVNVRDFQGKLEVVGLESSRGGEERHDGTSRRAELYLVRSAKDRESFKYRKMVIEHSPEKLKIRTDKEQRSKLFHMFGDNHGGEKMRAILKLPNGVNLVINGLGGRLKVESFEGQINVAGVSGRVEIANVTGPTKLEGVNGRVNVSVKSLTDDGLLIEGVNGAIDVALPDRINADVRASGVNGKVDVDFPNMTTSNNTFGNFEGKIGKGGPTIEFTGINGRVRVGTMAKAGAAAALEKSTPKAESRADSRE